MVYQAVQESTIKTPTNRPINRHFLNTVSCLLPYAGGRNQKTYINMYKLYYLNHPYFLVTFVYRQLSRAIIIYVLLTFTQNSLNNLSNISAFIS